LTLELLRPPNSDGWGNKLVTIYARHLDNLIVTNNLSLICQIHDFGSGQILQPRQLHLSPGFAKIAPWWLARRDYFLVKVQGLVSADDATNFYYLNRRAVRLQRTSVPKVPSRQFHHDSKIPSTYLDCNTDLNTNNLNLQAHMNNYKTEILKKICYTELVYERINKKLNKQLSKSEIEELILTIIKGTTETEFEKTGKNIYVTNKEKQVRLTINSNNYRIITADHLQKK
jgi:hypothetical protein